jgi:hypothetical protein
MTVRYEHAAGGSGHAGGADAGLADRAAAGARRAGRLVVAARGAWRDQPLGQLPVRAEPGAGLVALLAAAHQLAGSR